MRVNKFPPARWLEFPCHLIQKSTGFKLCPLTVPVFFNITVLRSKVRELCDIHCKGNPPPRAEGQRWEAQRVAEQCLETDGMMFERSEFLPPQALRQAASGEV